MVKNVTNITVEIFRVWNPTHFKSELRHNHLQNSQNFIAHQSKEDTIPTPRHSIPVKKRESTFEGVQRIVQRLVDDGFISEEFGERLIDEAAQNPDFATTIKLLGLLLTNITSCDSQLYHIICII